MGGSFAEILAQVEAHAALTQAVAAIISACIAGGALGLAVVSLRALRDQTEASAAMMTETFRPIVEVLGGDMREGTSASEISFRNKGNGAALNFRWRVDQKPERWGTYATNMIAPREEGRIRAIIDWRKGLVLSYNSVAQKDELLTYVSFGGDGSVINQHEVNQGGAVTRSGWTTADPSLAVPGWSKEAIAMLPWRARITHWWALRSGKEHRL